MTAPRSLMFSDAMVQRLLSGRKTQTRRRVQGRLQKATKFELVSEYGRRVWVCDVRSGHCPFTRLQGQQATGDLIWVKEAWTLTQHGKPVYRADVHDQTGQRWPSITPGDPHGEVEWRSTMRMPQWASRITLRVRSYRVERLHDITPSDCMAEGAVELHDGAGETWHSYGGASSTASGPPIYSFRLLWDSLYGEGAWARNEWVERIEFDVIQRNIAEVSRAGS